MKHTIAFYLISTISFICIAADNDTDFSESGYTSESEGSDSTDEDDLPLGYSISFECLHCPACQQVGIQDFVIVLIQPGAEAPYNSAATSAASVQPGVEPPYNSAVTSAASVQPGAEVLYNSAATSSVSVQPEAEVPYNSAATSVASVRFGAETIFNDATMFSTSKPLSNFPSSDESNNQDHRYFCGCFSFIKNLFLYYCCCRSSQR